MASSVQSRQNVDSFSPFSNNSAVNSSHHPQASELAGNVNAISRGQVRAVETDRGEAGVGIQIGDRSQAIKPSGIHHKSNLAMTGGHVLGEDGHAMAQRTMPKKSGAPDQVGTGNLTHQAAGVNKRNPFNQKRSTVGGQEAAPSDQGVGNAEEMENSDDSDDFNEFYMNNHPNFQGNGSRITGGMPGSGLADSSTGSSMVGTMRKFDGKMGSGQGGMYAGVEDGGRGSFNYQQQSELNNQLNRNMSQSHLTAAANAADSMDGQMQKEVELKAMGENSQMFQDSILQGNQRQGRMDGAGGLLAGAGASIMQQNMGAYGSISHSVEDQRVNINLEDVVLHEQKLATILDNLRNDQNASLSCEDWWDLTESTDLYNVIVYKLIKDIQLRQLMIQSQKYETLSVGIVQFYHLIASEQVTIDTKTSVNTYLKNLMHYIHQSFLVAAKFIYSRIVDKMGAGRSNVWISNLKTTLESKLSKPIRNKTEAVQTLRVNLENSDNIVKNIIKANQRKQFFSVLSHFMQRLPLFPNERLRDVLYNIEQFKFDAMLSPEIKLGGGPAASSSTQSGSSLSSGGSTASSRSGTSLGGSGAKSQLSTNKDTDRKTNSNSMAKKMIKDSDKSSGTNNLVGTGAGNSTLTGKNPFAILKASAIAATQKSMFPNNFSNLPKVSPPFLPPLDPSQKDKVYTLVLDLDETLIHNVEYGQDSFFLVRPGCVQFIELMAQYYEIVIFTAALQEYADQVVDQIDVNQNIKYRLYRQHTSQNGPFLVKDLSLLGRDLKKTIIIDNISDNFILQPDNGIFISTWYDDMSDNFLKEISPLLVELVEKKVSDVRIGMRSYRDQILRQISNNGQNISNIQFK